MVTSNTRKIFPGSGVKLPSDVFFTAELSVTVKPLLIGVSVVDVIAVEAVVGAIVVAIVTEAVVGLRICAGVAIVGGIVCAEVLAP
jgi:hypothetical protein